MRLNPADFNRFLAQIGQRALWRQSFVCPCTQEHSGSAESGCPICKGKGRTWNLGVECVIGVTGQRIDATTEGFGAMEAGDITLTIPSNSPVYATGRFDRVLLLNSTDIFSRVLTRGSNESLSDLAVMSVSRVFWRSPDKTALIDGGLPMVDANGALTWGDNPPALGVQYSITGVRYDEYFIYSALPSDRNEHSGAPLPRRVQARKFDLFGR